MELQQSRHALSFVSVVIWERTLFFACIIFTNGCLTCLKLRGKKRCGVVWRDIPLYWQIWLWEADLNRVEMTPVYHYDEFPSRVRIQLAELNFTCLLIVKIICEIFSFCLAGSLWWCLWLRSRVEWIAVGGFKKNSYDGQAWNSHANERLSSSAKAVDHIFI